MKKCTISDLIFIVKTSKAEILKIIQIKCTYAIMPSGLFLLKTIVSLKY